MQATELSHLPLSASSRLDGVQWHNAECYGDSGAGADYVLFITVLVI